MRRARIILGLAALIYVSALLLPAIAVPAPFGAPISFAGWQATLVALQAAIGPTESGEQVGWSWRLLFGAGVASNLLFLAALLTAVRAMRMAARGRAARVGAGWPRAVAIAMLLNATWLINQLLTGDAISSPADAARARATDSAQVAAGSIVIRVPTLLRVGYYLWLSSFALLALGLQQSRASLAPGTTRGAADVAARNSAPAA